MPKEYSRTLRVGEQIRRELAVLVQQEVKDPRLGIVTITDVELSTDLTHAKIYITVLDEEGDAQKSVTVLNHAAGFLRHELARRMVLRLTPSLHFYYDRTIKHAADLSALIDRVVAADKKHQD